MARALADHSPETLRKYALKVYDASTRFYRTFPFTDAKVVLMRAMDTLNMALAIDYGKSACAPLATEINETLAALNKLRTNCGDTPVTL